MDEAATTSPPHDPDAASTQQCADDAETADDVIITDDDDDDDDDDDNVGMTTTTASRNDDADDDDGIRRRRTAQHDSLVGECPLYRNDEAAVHLPKETICGVRSSWQQQRRLLGSDGTRGGAASNASNGGSSSSSSSSANDGTTTATATNSGTRTTTTADERDKMGVQQQKGTAPAATGNTGSWISNIMNVGRARLAVPESSRITANSMWGVDRPPSAPPPPPPPDSTATVTGSLDGFIGGSRNGLAYINTAAWGLLTGGERCAFRLFYLARRLTRMWLTHVLLVLVLLGYTAVGGALFVSIEAPHERRTVLEVAQARRNLSRELWRAAQTGTQAEYDDEYDWRMRDYEEALYKAYSQGLDPEGHDKWSFFGAVFYCGTVISTIGYGNIAPSTNTGRALTIAYAVIGIPLLLMVLADFGKLFTRCIKLLYVSLLRFYYTGSCRRVRMAAPVKVMVKAFSAVPGMTSPSNNSSSSPEQQQHSTTTTTAGGGGGGVAAGTTTTAVKRGSALGTTAVAAAEEAVEDEDAPPYLVDEKFDVPVSVAFVLLICYILFGGLLFIQWEEDWTYFQAVYFVFISLSTIGFGDFVPRHPSYLMATFVYLLFGLALTSMCINVIQESLTHTFREATLKLSSRMGIPQNGEEEEEEEGGGVLPIELAPVHSDTTSSKSIKAE